MAHFYENIFLHHYMDVTKPAATDRKDISVWLLVHIIKRTRPHHVRTGSFLSLVTSD